MSTSNKKTLTKAKAGKAQAIAIEKSSGNVFADLGLADPEIRRAKSELAHEIGKIIKKRKLTQVAAARTLGIDQPKVSRIMTGKLSDFSADRLMMFLIRLGCNVNIGIKEPKSLDTGDMKAGDLGVSVLAAI